MNPVLTRWNSADLSTAADEILPCCGSHAWAERLSAERPYESESQLLEASDVVWAGLAPKDWFEAFESHPRIGQQHAAAATAQSLAWSSQEQRAAVSDTDSLTSALADANRRYEEKFGRIFIICATGKRASEILCALERRMENSPDQEILETAEQQRQITQLRLRKWLEVS